MKRLFPCLLAICFALGAGAAPAQNWEGRGDRGGSDRGSRRGGFDRGGGDRFSGRGGPSSSPQDRNARMEEMLRRLDTNGNGMLDQEEAASGPGRFMVERMFGQMGIQANYPIPLSELKQSLEKAFQNRGPGGPQGGRGSRGGLPGAPNSFNGQSRSGPPGSNSTPTAAPSTVQGFGAPTAGSSPAASPGTPTAANASVDQKIRALAEAIVRKYDANANAGLELNEWPARSPWGSFSEANRTAGVSLSAADLAGYLLDLHRSGRLTSLDLPEAQNASAPADPAKTSRPKSGRFLTAKERLPAGLPDWFLQNADDDGQVPMAAFTENWTPEALAGFLQYDLNRDGIITPAECLKVEKQRAAPK